jgi:hypothetical protein
MQLSNQSLEQRQRLLQHQRLDTPRTRPRGVPGFGAGWDCLRLRQSLTQFKPKELYRDKRIPARTKIWNPSRPREWTQESKSIKGLVSGLSNQSLNLLLQHQRLDTTQQSKS